MKMRFATDEEIAKWDEIVPLNSDGGNVLQGKVFAEIKSLSGWQPRYIISDTGAFVALEKAIFLLGKVWYIPKGPGVASTKELCDILEELVPLARTNGVFTVKIEPELLLGTDMSGLSLVPTRPIQYNCSTVVVDLHDDLDTVMKNLPQKGRHAIRRAERDGVKVELVESSPENCNRMYELFKETANGAGFVIRPREYYHEFYRRYSETGQGQLFFAYFDDKLVAGAYALIYGDKSTYKDGASVRQRTAYGASHLLQWNVIQWAKEHNASVHDFCGSPPSDEITNPDHPHYGVGLFKLSFSKHIVDYVGCYDYILSPVRHKAWVKLGERIHRHLYYKRTKDYYY